MSRGGEFERIALLARHFAGDAAGTLVGIGDDAAVLSAVGEPLVWTIDAQVEGTHFRLDWLDWEDVGWRSFMAAASDVAAMGAIPLAALSALSLADGVDDAALDALASGQASAARLVGTSIIGGNLARGTETSVTTTLLGRASRPILRSGARVGDGIFLAGPIGEAAAGLAALSSERVDAKTMECITAWRRPRALMAEGLVLRASASAAIDVSDGFSRDAAHIAEASGVLFVIDEVVLRARASEALERAAAFLGRDVLELMLDGGEDYALVATSASATMPGFDRIGSVEPGAGAIVLQKADGARVSVTPRGYDHFKS